MKRRRFLRRLGSGALVTGAALAAACKQENSSPQNTATVTAKFKPVKWKMVTTWPKNFPGLGTGANFLAERITQMSGGRIQVKVYGAKELVPAFEVFSAVRRERLNWGTVLPITGKVNQKRRSFFPPCHLV